MFSKSSIKIYYFIIISLFFFNCSKIDPATNERILIEPDPEKKAKEFAKKGGGIFGDINNQRKSNTNFEFSTSNVLWRSTLKSLEFLPMLNADYQGGIIVYDWYSDDSNSKEQLKISVRFTSNELRSESIEIIAHKKTCDDQNKCITKKIVNDFTRQIKDTIVSNARILRIEESKKNKD
jgi:hypothetical protein